MRVLVCGDRKWSDRTLIEARLVRFLLEDAMLVITGGAKGADTLAHEIARGMGYETVVVVTEWYRYGRAAGPIRNRAMLGLGPDLVLAFHDDLQRSRGTRDCVNEALRLGIKVEVIGHAQG